MGGAGCVGGQEKEWMGCSLDDLRAFGINTDQWATTAQDEGEWRRTAEQEAEHFMTKWIVAEKTKAGLRHAVVCLNVTGRTKERIAKSKCYVCFVLLCFVFRLYAFVEAAALRSIFLRHAGAPIATCVFFLIIYCFFIWRRRFSPAIFCTISAFFLYGEYAVRSFLPNDVFLPCDHGLGF